MILLRHPTASAIFQLGGPDRSGRNETRYSAPGAFVAAVMSSDAVAGMAGGSIFDGSSVVCGNGPVDCTAVDATHAVLSGSSMSAPEVAGAVALLFQRDHSLTQADVVSLVTAGVHRPSGIVRREERLGAGSLDVEGTMAAYDMTHSPVAREPDPQKSWLVLSTHYARPDPLWPVVGKVVLRTVDDLIADGFDSTNLVMTATNAIVLEPLERTGPGLFRFQVAGADGTGQQTMQIDVRYRGASIGLAKVLMRGHAFCRFGPTITSRSGASTWSAARAPCAVCTRAHRSRDRPCSSFRP